MIALDLVAERAEARHLAGVGDAALEQREEIALLVVVVVGGGLLEVPQHGLRRGACFGIDALLGDVRTQALERFELLLDAAMARQQHLERIVERHDVEKAR